MSDGVQDLPGVAWPDPLEQSGGQHEFTGELLLARRPDVYQAAARALFLERMSKRAISRMLGISRGTVDAIEERELTLHPELVSSLRSRARINLALAQAHGVEQLRALFYDSDAIKSAGIQGIAKALMILRDLDAGEASTSSASAHDESVVDDYECLMDDGLDGEKKGAGECGSVGGEIGGDVVGEIVDQVGELGAEQVGEQVGELGAEQVGELGAERIGDGSNTSRVMRFGDLGGIRDGVATSVARPWICGRSDGVAGADVDGAMADGVQATGCSSDGVAASDGAGAGARPADARPDAPGGGHPPAPARPRESKIHSHQVAREKTGAPVTLSSSSLKEESGFEEVSEYDMLQSKFDGEKTRAPDGEKREESQTEKGGVK